MKNTTLPFEVKMQQNERILRNYALQLTQNMDDANDLVQETFLKAMLYSSKFKEMAKETAASVEYLPLEPGSVPP